AQLAVLFLRLGTRFAKLCLKDHIGAYIPVRTDNPFTARRCPVEGTMGTDMPDLTGRQNHAEVAEERGAVTKRTGKSLLGGDAIDRMQYIFPCRVTTFGLIGGEAVKLTHPSVQDQPVGRRIIFPYPDIRNLQ